MQLDTRVILGGQPVNGVNALAQGQLAGAAQAQRGRDQEYRNALAQYGPGAAQGSQDALGQLARFEQFGPQSGAAIRQGDQGLAQGEERLRLAREEAAMRAREFAAQMSAAERQQMAQQAETVAGQIMMASPEQYPMILQQNGIDPAQYPIEARDQLIIELMGTTEGLSALSDVEGLREQRATAAAGYPQNPMVQVNTGDQAPRNGDVLDMGNVPQGMVAIRDDSAPGGVRLVPLTGGPEDTSAQDAARQSSRETLSDVILNAATRAIQADENRITTGLAGQVAAMNPSNENAELRRQAEVLRSNATIESLNAMRRESPTGGALGNVTEGEGRMLAARAGALDPDSPNFARDVRDYTLTLLRTVHGFEAGTEIYNQTFSDDQRPAQERGFQPSSETVDDAVGAQNLQIPTAGTGAAALDRMARDRGLSSQQVWDSLSDQLKRRIIAASGQ